MKHLARFACLMMLAGTTTACQSISGLDDLHVHAGTGSGGAGGMGSGGMDGMSGGGGMDGVSGGGGGGGLGGSGGGQSSMDAQTPMGGGGGATPDMDAGMRQTDGQVAPGDAGGCKANELICDDVCVPNDARNCGKCGHDCTGLPNVAGSVSCDQGACVIPASACAMGHGHCTSDPDDGCETDLTLPAHCGTCDTKCDSAAPLCVAPASGDASAMPHCVSACPSDTPDECDQTCVDTQSNPAHCGGCDKPCAGTDHGQGVCNGGHCAIDCNTDYHDCPGDLCLDDKSGLSCGTMCDPCSAPQNAAPACTNAACDFACLSTFHRCGNACASNTSTDSCGSSCSACSSRAHATTGCDGSSCTYSCNSPYVANGNTCECPVCAQGAAQCSSGGLKTCSNVSSGCGTWSNAQDCSLHACYDGTHCLGLTSIEFGSGAVSLLAKGAVDAGGRMAVFGATPLATFEGQGNAGSNDAFLTTFPSALSPRTTKMIGTTASDSGESIAVDSSNDRFVVAGITAGALESGSTAEPNSDVFVESWNLSGTPTRVWGKQFGTSAGESTVVVAVDANANVFVAGITKGSFPNATLSGTDDLFISKLRGSDGAVQWTYQWVQSTAVTVNAIACDSSGNVYVGGSYNSDALLTKWSPSAAGSLTWQKTWGSTDNEFVTGIGFDNSGNVFASGTTQGSASFDGNAPVGGYDAFITRFDSAGNNRQSQRWGTSAGDQALGMANDNAGNLYVVGSTGGGFPGFTAPASGSQVFVTRWQPSLTRDWTAQFTTASFPIVLGASIAIDDANNLFVTANMTNVVSSSGVFVSKLNAASGL